MRRIQMDKEISSIFRPHLLLEKSDHHLPVYLRRLIFTKDTFTDQLIMPVAVCRSITNIQRKFFNCIRISVTSYLCNTSQVIN